MNRRAFLTSGVVSAIGAASSSAALPVPSGLSRAKLPTPALLLDLEVFEANLKKMAEHCRQAKVGFRPHAKTHKCPEIARRQIAAGALGVCVATVPEAEAMVQAGIKGVLLTSPIVEPLKIARMIELARKERTVMLSVGDAREVTLLGEGAKAAGLTLPVLIDLDVGDRRTGVLPEKAVELAKAIGTHQSLALKGVQAYAGHASHTAGFDKRAEVSRKAMQLAVQVKNDLIKAGFDAAILSGGSTGTYNIDSALEGVTELQVGSFIFMDVNYRAIGGKSGQVYTDFQPSLTVLTTVVNAAHADRVSVDAGTKAFSTDSGDLPEAVGRAGLSYRRGGDEFGILTIKEGKLPALGERLEFLVPHCDPTVNLYDRLYVLKGDAVAAIWPIVARREN